MAITNLCSPGVAVRATKYEERKATPGAWASAIGAQVAVNADFFDFPGWTHVLARARGEGQEWPAGAEQFLAGTSYWQFGPGYADFQPVSAAAPAPYATQIVGGYHPLIRGGKVFDFASGDPFMLQSYRRTAIGLSADRSVLYLYASAAAINGPNMVAEMAAMAAEGGAPPIDVATNEDGGGSTQMYLQGQGQIIDSGRQVNTHLGIYAGGGGPPQNCPLTRSGRSNGGIASWDANRLDLFIHSKDAPNHKWWDGRAWSSWEPLGPVASDVAATSWSAGRLDLFALASDGSLTHRFWGGNGWGQDSLGGSLASAPVATSWGNNRVDAFALATDKSIAHWGWTGANWVHDSLGGAGLSSPAVTAWSANRLDVFVEGTDHQLWHKAWSGQSWGTWEPLGGELGAPPAVASFGTHALNVFIVSPKGSVSHRWWNGGSWNAWEDLGGNTAAPVSAVTSPARLALDIFSVDADHTLIHRAWSGKWGEWERLGGANAIVTSRAPAVVSRDGNGIDVFAEGIDHRMKHMWFDGQKWNGWEDLGGTFAFDDAAAEPTGESTAPGSPPSSSDSSATEIPDESPATLPSPTDPFANGGTNEACAASAGAPAQPPVGILLLVTVVAFRRRRDLKKNRQLEPPLVRR